MKYLFLFPAIFICVLKANSQKVGIGINNPQYSLHVHTTGPDGSILITNLTTSALNTDGLRLRISNLNGSIDNLENGDISISTNKAQPGLFGTPEITIKPTGAVGIGTNNPNAKLDVAGQVKITGGSPGVGKVLTSDAAGLASWVLPEVGNHSHYGQTFSGNTAYSGLIIQNNSTDFQATGIDVSSTGSNNLPVAIKGTTRASNGIGVLGASLEGELNPTLVPNSGVVGLSNNGNGVSGSSLTGYAVYGVKGSQSTYTGTVAFFKNENPANTAPVVKISGVASQPALELNNGYIKVSGVNKTAFTITGTELNTSGYILTLNYPNQLFTDILLVTHNFSPPGLGTSYHNIPVGVFWTGSAWAIFSEDTNTPMLGKAFNVLVIKQ